MVKVAIIQFPGSNCERETRLAIERAGMEAVDVLWNSPLEPLSHFDAYVIIGGFSYEDRCRSGLIASKDKLMDKLAEQAELGKPILGICNGAQILVESGLVPGLAHRQIGMALTHNKRMRDGKVLGTGFYNDWCRIKTKTKPEGVFNRHYSEALYIPLAHGEGRFIVPDEVWQALQNSQAEIWQYCDPAGAIVDEFPVNPNGSMHNIAGISNASGNVLALMPHPERTPNGNAIFTSMRDYIQSQKKVSVKPLALELSKPSIAAYQCPQAHHEIAVQLLINDNEAITVQKALQQLGLPVKVEKFIHWELASNEPFSALLKRIADTNELFQPSKERCVEVNVPVNSVAFLVRENEDMLEAQKLHILQTDCGLPIQTLKRGILWKITAEQAESKAIAEQLMTRSILFNPYAHQCFYYEKKA